MCDIKRLCDLEPGQRAVASPPGAENGLRRRLMDIGLVEGTEVECVLVSPAGDPKAYLIRGAVIAIRREDGADVPVTGC